MKVFLDYKLDMSGKSKFLRRLIPALEKLGVYCVRSQKADVALGISKWQTKTALPKVLRVDGIHLKKGPKFDWRNKQIRKSIKMSDIVIYQSQYSKYMTEKHLRVSTPSYVIYNGASPEDYVGLVRPEGFEKHKINILMCARWANRKSKRLGLHFEVAAAAQDMHFWLAGECDAKSNKNVTVLGILPDEQLRRYQAHADALLYLAHPDWCPNTVVETAVSGTPIVCLKGSGVEELVQMARGVSCSKDINAIVEALRERALIKYPACAYSLYISAVAQKYKAVFEGLLNA